MLTIKRHIALQPYSRDHHNARLLCWKIRKGLSLGIDPERIHKYVCWFYVRELLPHFELEEQYLFPVAGNNSRDVIRAIREHKKLKRMVYTEKDVLKCISLFEELLDQHIRFEERVLFNLIQQKATIEELDFLYHQHNKVPNQEVWPDEFWRS